MLIQTIAPRIVKPIRPCSAELAGDLIKCIFPGTTLQGSFLSPYHLVGPGNLHLTGSPGGPDIFVLWNMMQGLLYLGGKQVSGRTVL